MPGGHGDWGSLGTSVSMAETRGSWRGWDCPGRTEQGRGGGPAAAGTPGTGSRALQLPGICNAADPAAAHPQGTRDQTASAGSLFSSSECVAAERRQFVGKQTPGRGRYRPAASLPRTRAAHTPPRGALGLTRGDRRDCASPHPHSRPGFRFRQGPPCACNTETPAGPPRPLEGPAVPALPARHPAFPAAV